eukprot:SAG31_NODE_806_length_11957_cov_2.232670_4_plen_97_part_00
MGSQPISRGVLLMLLFRILETGGMLLISSTEFYVSSDTITDDKRAQINKSAHESKLVLAVYLSVASFACFLAAAEMKKLLDARGTLIVQRFTCPAT